MSPSSKLHVAGREVSVSQASNGPSPYQGLHRWVHHKDLIQLDSSDLESNIFDLKEKSRENSTKGVKAPRCQA